MNLRPRTLGQQLRAIVLATPFLGGACCLETVNGPDGGALDSGMPIIDAGLDGGVLPDSGQCPPSATLDGGLICSFRLDFSFQLPDGGTYVPGPCPTCLAACEALGFGAPCDCALDAGAVTCDYFNHTGRRPAGFVPTARASSPSVLGAYLATAAQLEAASVPAFRTLAGELRRQRAPEILVQAAGRSAREEVRHAQVTAALARRHGAVALWPMPTVPPQERPLEAIATENAIEGCARETCGALIATWQGQHATDQRLRHALAAIAVEEGRHAELAWQVAAWAEPRLPRAARRRVQEARDAAFAALGAQLERPAAPALIARAGLPPPHSARRLQAQLEAALNG